MKHSRLPRWQIALLTWFSVLAAPGVHALEISGGITGIQLPGSSYLYQGYQTQLTGRIGSGSYSLTAAGVLPYEILGYTHSVASLSFTREFSLSGGARSSFFDPFVGIGPGLYLDQVNSSSGWVPSLVTRGGVRVGHKNFGVIGQFECHAGIYSFSQLRSWVIWPLVELSGGIYVAF